MKATGTPSRRIWDVMDRTGTNIVNWLALLLVVSTIEYFRGAFEEDPYQTYTFVVLQAPFHGLVIYASVCMMHIGFHLAVLCKQSACQFFLTTPLIRGLHGGVERTRRSDQAGKVRIGQEKRLLQKGVQIVMRAKSCDSTKTKMLARSHL